MVTPWEKGQSEVLSAPGFGKEMWKVTFTRPDGQKEDFFLFGQYDGADILSITSDGMVIAIWQFKQGANKVILGIPGGRIDAHEDEADTAERELLEETGYKAGEMISLGDPIFMVPGGSWTRFFLFLALSCEKVGEPQSDPLEETEVVLIPLKEWMRLAETTLEASSAVAATTRARPYLVELGFI